MNPFDSGPTGSPVDLDPPVIPPVSRRGRMVLVALVTAALVGGGFAGASQFASADRPGVAATVPTTVADDDGPDPAPEDQTTRDEPASTTEPKSEPNEPSPGVDGEIVIDFGGDEPITIDLDRLDADSLDRIRSCIGTPVFDFDFSESGNGPWFGDIEEMLDALPNLDADVGEFDVFDQDGTITVIGPDGVSVIDLGEDGSVTITKDDGAITVETAGDASVSDLSDLLDEFGAIFGNEFDRDQLDGFLDEFLEGIPAIEIPEPLDPAVVRSCIDEVLGR